MQRGIVPTTKKAWALYFIFACFIATQCKFKPRSILLENKPKTSLSPSRDAPRNPAVAKYPICTKVAVGREPYVCDGPAYEEFADRLDQFVLWMHGETNTLESYYRNTSEFERKTKGVKTPVTSNSPMWGMRRPFPFPDHSHILAVGSSHTRSIFLSIACQYPLLKDVELIHDNVTFPVRRGAYFQFEFENHATLDLITNHELFYETTWQQDMEKLVGRSLADFDAMFYGRFNDVKTTLDDGSIKWRHGKTLLDMANAYSGPIVAHTLLADWGCASTWFSTLYDQKVELQTYWPERARTIWVLDGNKYMDALDYCSTDEWKTAGVCENHPYKHACMGKRGGHADLMAWDVLEAMYEMWDRAKAMANEAGGQKRVKG